MNTAVLVKVAKSTAGALVIGFLSREIAAAAGFTFKALVKGVIRHSVVAQRGIKSMVDEAKAEIQELANEAMQEADHIEQAVAQDTAGSNASASTAV